MKMGVFVCLGSLVLVSCVSSDNANASNIIKERIESILNERHRGAPDASFVAISDEGYKQMIRDGLFSLHDNEIGRETELTPAGNALLYDTEINSDDCQIVDRPDDRNANCAFFKPKIDIDITVNDDLAYPGEGQTAEIYFSMTYDAPSSVAKYLVQGASGTARMTLLNGELTLLDFTVFDYIDPTDTGRLDGKFYP